MSKRGMLTRQKSLAVQEDAIKIIEKYCRKKYRNSTFVVGSSLPIEIESTSATPEQKDAPMSPLSALPLGNRYSYFSSQSLDNHPTRLSNVFLAQSTVESHTPISSPFHASELFHTPIKEEIKPRPAETVVKYLWRLFNFLYEHCGLKDILLVLLIVLYSLFGGLIFYHLEAPEAELQLQRQRNETHIRQLNFTKQITRTMLSIECRNFIASTNLWKDTDTYDEEAFNHCVQRIRYIINLYDYVAGVDPLGKKAWSWDYWNAVFYAWTLLTTIGYGNLSCKTNIGRMITICYALLGLPMMLIVLNILGKRLFLLLQSLWKNFRSKFKRRTKKLYRLTKARDLHLVTNEMGVDKNSKENLTEQEYVEEKIDLSDDMDIFETFPLKLALAIVFLYIGLCSVIFRYWESHWDFFTAFYFFFISLSTIGLGDEMPRHPHYAVGFFIFFVIGLSLVSMCFSILQSRLENKYMAAFQMIDEENNKIAYSHNLVSIEDITSVSNNKNEPMSVTNYIVRPGSILLNTNTNETTPKSDAKIKWRQNSAQTKYEETVLSNGRRISIITNQAMEDPNRSPYNRVTSNGSSMSSLASTPVFSPTPPVLGAFLARKQSFKKNIVYSQQVEPWSDKDTGSPSSQSKKHQRPDDLGNLSPGSEKFEVLLDTTPTQNAVHPGLRTSLFTVPLSVITESEEEVKETSRNEKNSQKRRPPPLKVLVANA